MAEGSEKEIREGGRAVSASLGQILNLKETEYRVYTHCGMASGILSSKVVPNCGNGVSKSK